MSGRSILEPSQELKDDFANGDRCARAVVSFSLNFCICSQKEKWLSFTSVREAQKGGKQLPPWSHLPVARATAGGTRTDIEVLCISL